MTTTDTTRIIFCEDCGRETAHRPDEANVETFGSIMGYDYYRKLFGGGEVWVCTDGPDGDADGEDFWEAHRTTF